MTRCWLLLALAVSLSVLSGCVTAASQPAQQIQPTVSKQAVPDTTDGTPYAHNPDPVLTPLAPSEQKPTAPTEPVPSPPPQPIAIIPPSPASSASPTLPTSPASPTTPVSPTALPTAEPPVVDAVARACKLELAGQHAAAVQLLHDAGLHDVAARMLLLRAVRAGGAPADLSALDAVLPEVKELERQLQARAPLTLNKACFCKRILGFGLYDPLPDHLPSFLGGTEGRPGERVLLYIEVGNFQTLKTELGDNTFLHETMLTGSLQIKPSGLATSRAPATTEIKIPHEVRPSRSPRQDYFMRLEFNVPPGLAPGTYTLEVKLEDETPPLLRGTKTRQASRMLEFRVVEAR